MEKIKTLLLFTLLTITLTMSGCLWDFFGRQSKPTPPPFFPQQIQTPMPVVTPTSSTMTTYTNPAYGFAISFPKTLHTEMPFSTSYLLANRWRYGADEKSKGIPVISIPVVRIPNQNFYPLFYNVEVRIGISTDPNDLKIVAAGPGNGEISVRTESINGIAFRVFQFQDAAMMKYVFGYSYRIVHNNTCYVIEQIKSGSNYRDKTDPRDIPETVLDDYFRQAGDIVKTFVLTR